MNELGSKMYLRRKELGLTLEEVGQAVGVGKSTVRRWENGMIKNMGRDKLIALAKILQMNPLELVPYGEQDGEKTEHDTPYNETAEATSEEQRILFRLAKTAKPEAIRAAVAVLKSMEETNHDF